MFTTSNATWPVGYWDWTEVKADEPETVRVLAEVDLYLAGVARMWTWLFHVYQCMGPQDGPLWMRHVGRFTHLRTSWVNNLPDTYKLKKSYGSTYSYRTHYVSGSALSESRPVVLANVDGLLNGMRACEAAIVRDQDFPANTKSVCKLYLQDTELLFQQYMEMARPHVMPSHSAQRRREQAGRGHGGRATAHARAAQLQLLRQLQTHIT